MLAMRDLMSKAQEKALVRRLIKMDEKAWEGLCKEYSLPLQSYIQLYFGCDREKAEEFVHMTFVRCVRSIKTFDPSRGRLYDWLKAICRNEAHTLLKQEQKLIPAASLSTYPGQMVDGVLAKIDSVPLPDEVLAAREVQLLIHDTIMELSARYRKVLVMKYIENRKVAEIAQKLGQTEKAIESLLSRCRQSFKKVFFRKAKDMEIKEGKL
jgi:RNA polymerase sigma-70 factor (ECF subfamily)